MATARDESYPSEVLPCVRLPKIDSRKPRQGRVLTEAPIPSFAETAKSLLPCSRTISTTPAKYRALVNIPKLSGRMSTAHSSDSDDNVIRHPLGRCNKERVSSTRIHASAGRTPPSKKHVDESSTSSSNPVAVSRLGSLRTVSPLSSKKSTRLQKSRTVNTQPRIRAGVTSNTVHGQSSLTGRRNFISICPPPMASRALPTHGRGPIYARNEDWRNWTEIGVRFFGFSADVTTKDVWKIFSKEGGVSTIELYHSEGKLSGNGRVWFRPPPKNAFWQAPSYQIKSEDQTSPLNLEVRLEPPRRSFHCQSPVNPKVSYPEVMTLHADCLDFGLMYDPTTMMGMYRTRPTKSTGIRFQQDMTHREIEVSFPIVVPDPKPGNPSRMEDYCFVIPLAQPVAMHQIETGRRCVLLVSLEGPPNFYRKYDEGKTHQEEATSWNRREALFRQTDIMFDPRILRTAPVTLKKSKPIIDIGRWTTYHLVFDMTRNNAKTYSTICDALRDYNIEILPLEGFKLITDREPAVWDYIDRPVPRRKKKASTALDDLQADDAPRLPFPVRYQLEVCISEGYLNEHNMTKEFVDKLIEMEPLKAQDLLEYVANQKTRIYNPTDIFNFKIVKGSASRLMIPHYCTYVRSATITPSTIYYSTPTVETSNRVVRQYAEYADRFLRVRFADEKFQGRLNATQGESMNEIYTRVHRALINGITIGDRHFEFLASGNSQFREHGAYFFAPVEHVRVTDIRTWMGDFHDIQVVALYIARLGQCFSTTRAIHGARARIVEDLQDNVLTVSPKQSYNFTDGVGKISKFLAQVAASEVGLTMLNGEPPSVFQFRLGGCKGVLTVWPDARMRDIHVRPSQYKFPSKFEGLEIIRWSQFSIASLNRQLIMILSALQVPDSVFVDMLKLQLSNLAQAMGDETMALGLLQKEIDPNQMTLTLAGMILDGFQRMREPFMISLLQLWRAWSIKYLKEKAKIAVHKGAILLGCVDETLTLQGHFDKLQKLRSHESEEMRLKSLPEIFVQLSKGANDKPEVITGPMALARNPSLHPGDVRVVRGVDVAVLRHLKDVVVLPQTGDRDISSMCSGGDLDGDDYVVIWDRALLPREWNNDPMDYNVEKPPKLGRPITTPDITSFFVTYMKNNSLPSIATAHLATADWEKEGAKSQKCLELATLHSKAVDYVKTGEAATIPRQLRPQKWPHYMEKDHLRAEKRYISRTVLGQLYDQVERVDFVPEYDAPFDKRILDAYELSDKLLADAEEVKELYDASMHRIMAQHAIHTEFEVWSTFVLSHANQSNDYKFHEEMGNIATVLKDRFRLLCYEKAGGRDFEKLGPFAAAMYKVTRNQMARALKECQRVRFVGGREEKVGRKSAQTMPLMSFPWLFQGVLGKIANGELSGPTATNLDHTVTMQGHQKKTPFKKKHIGLSVEEEDVVQTSEGITHRGELLELFHDSGEKLDQKRDPSRTSDMPDSIAYERHNLKYEDPSNLDQAKPFSRVTNPATSRASLMAREAPIDGHIIGPQSALTQHGAEAGPKKTPQSTADQKVDSGGRKTGNLIDFDLDTVVEDLSHLTCSTELRHTQKDTLFNDLLGLETVNTVNADGRELMHSLSSGVIIENPIDAPAEMEVIVAGGVEALTNSQSEGIPKPRKESSIHQEKSSDQGLEDFVDADDKVVDMSEGEEDDTEMVDLKIRPSLLERLENLVFA